MKSLSIHLTKTQITLGIKAAVLITAVIILFSQDLIIVFKDALYSETTSYLLAIPALFAYLIYRKRKMLRAVIPVENENEPKEIRYIPQICGILLSITAMLLYWYGSYTFIPLEYHIIALPIFVAGLTLILFNPQTLRQLVFPIAFLVFLTPPPSETLYTLGTVLSIVSSEASNTIVNILGIPSTITTEYANPVITVIQPNGTSLEFTVDIACSGIYGLIGFLIVAIFMAYLIRGKTWKKFALIIAGIPLIYSLNIIRIVVILMLGYYYGETLALQIFHLLGGWMLIFLGTILLLVLSEKILKTQFFEGSHRKCTKCNSYRHENIIFCLLCGRIIKPPKIKFQRNDILKMITVIVAVVLLACLQVPVFVMAKTQPIIVINTPEGEQVSTNILPRIQGYNLYFLYRDRGFEQKAKQDMSVVYLYSPINQTREQVFVAIEIASTRSSLHRWETCLITWPLRTGKQPRASQIELTDIKLIENPPLISRYFAFTYTDTNETQAVLYWFETATFTINSTFQQEYVKISLIAYPETIEKLSEIKGQLVSIAQEIVAYWQPIKTWSQITLVISQNGLSLITVTVITLAAIIIVYCIQKKKLRLLNTNAYKKMSKENKQLVNAVKVTEKNLLPVLNNIAITHQKITTKTIRREQLLNQLSELEKTGIINALIYNKNDEPFLIWKAYIE